MSTEESALRLGLANSEQNVEALTSRVAGLQRTVESQCAALQRSEASLSAGGEEARTLAESLAEAVARGDALESDLNALRTLTGAATGELREEVALLRAQVDGAERTAAELKSEAEAAVAAAAAARASEARTAGEAARAAEEAAGQRAADREAIEALRATASEVAGAAADEARQQESADALSVSSRRGAGAAERLVDGSNTPARTGEGDGNDDDIDLSRRSVHDARLRSLGLELESVGLVAREAVASAVCVGGWAPPSPSPTGGRDGGGGDSDDDDDAVLGGQDGGVGIAVLPEVEEKEESRDNFEGGGGRTQHDDDGDEIGRMLAVAGQAVADVESVRRALVVAEEKVRPARYGMHWDSEGTTVCSRFVVIVSPGHGRSRSLCSSGASLLAVCTLP